MTAIPRRERLIVALDVPAAAEARSLVERIGDAACFYKVGLELFAAGGALELVGWLAGRGNRVFADLKLYDIPETVARAVASLRGSGAAFLTVHGHRSVMAAAAREKGAMKILAAIHPPDTTRNILQCLGLPTRPPPLAPAVSGLASHIDSF